MPALPKDALPIGDYYTLLDSRTYTRTAHTIVALCALESRHGQKELKLYRWVWKGEGKGWKVDLANMNIQGLDLHRVAEDARDMSQRFTIPLRWS